MSASSPRLGKLNAHLVLPEDSHLPHYGPEDAVTGKVVVSYKADNHLVNRLTGKDADTSDLFGPLKLEIVLHGRLKLNIHGDGSTSDRGDPIFSKTFIVHQGGFRAEVGHEYNFPFSICFPSSSGTIPPSFRLKFMSRACTLIIVIQYWLSAQLSIPGIEVKTQFRQVGEKPWVKYELPRPMSSVSDINQSLFRHRVKIQNAYLLPEDQRPQGLRQKAKAALTSRHFPRLIFDVCCTDIQQIHPEKPLSFTITISPTGESSSSTLPDASLELFRVQLVARTHVEPGPKSTTKRPWNDCRTVQQLGSRRSLPMLIIPGEEQSTIITTEPVVMLPSSFQHAPVSRNYELKIAMHLTIANRKIRVNRVCPVTVLPAPFEQPTRASRMASTLRQSFALTEVETPEEEAPSYISSEIEERRPSYSSSQLPGLDPSSKLRLGSP